MPWKDCIEGQRLRNKVPDPDKWRLSCPSFHSPQPMELKEYVLALATVAQLFGVLSCKQKRWRVQFLVRAHT